MKDINSSLKFWLEELEKYEVTPYEKLPDIDLYMDQMITYLERNLNTFSLSSLDKQITSSMINNYVKSDTIPSPIGKKYNKEHLALIEETFALKQVLTINEIKQILDVKYDGNNNAEAFNSFKRVYGNKTEEACQLAKSQLRNVGENDVYGLTDVAINLACAANAYITIAKRILFLLKKNEELKENE